MTINLIKVSKAYLEYSQTSTMELLYKNSEQPKAFNYFRWVLNTIVSILRSQESGVYFLL